MPEIFFGAGETVPANNETGVTPAWPIFWVKGDVNTTAWGNSLYWEEFVTLTEKGDSTLIPLKVWKYDRPRDLIVDSAFDYRWPDGSVNSIRIDVLDNLKEDTQYTLNFIKGKLKDGSGNLVSDHKFPHTINFTTGKFLKVIPVNPINHQHNFPLTGWSFTYNTNMFMNYVADYNFGFQRLLPSGLWSGNLHQGISTSGQSSSNGGLTRHYSVSRDMEPDRWFRIYWNGGTRRWLGENSVRFAGVKGNDDFDGVRLSFPGYMVNQYVHRYENQYVYFFTGDPSGSVATDPLQATVSIGYIWYNSSFPFHVTLDFNKEVREPGANKTVSNRFNEGALVKPSFILRKQGVTDLSLEQDADGNYIHKEIKLVRSNPNYKQAKLEWTHTTGSSGYYRNFQPGTIYELEIKDWVDYYGANVLEPLPIYTIEAPPHPNIHFNITDGATDVDYADPEAMQMHIDQNPNQSKWNAAHTNYHVQLHKQRSPGSVYYDMIDKADVTWVKTIGSENTSKSFDHRPNGNRFTATYWHYTFNVTGGLEPDTNYKFRYAFKQLVSNEYAYDINQVPNYGSSFVEIQFKTKAAAPALPVIFGIDSISPDEGATDVDAADRVVVDFNKEVDIDTIRNVPRGIIIRSTDGVGEYANWSISSDKKHVNSTPIIYEPSRQFATGSIYHTSQYTTTVKTQVTATDGDTLGSDHVVTYTIAVHPTIYKTRFRHPDSTVEVPYTDFGSPVSTLIKIDQIPGVFFDQPMDESLIDDTTIWLEDNSGNKITDVTYFVSDWFPAAIHVDTTIPYADNKMTWMEIRPNNPLDHSTIYKLKVKGLGALKDTSGRKLHHHFTQYFTTEDPAPNNFAHAIEIFPNGHYPPLKDIAKGTYPINHPFNEPVSTEFPTFAFVNDDPSAWGDSTKSFDYSSHNAFGLRRKSDGVDIPLDHTFGVAAVPGIPLRKAIRFTTTVALDDGVEYEFYANRSLILLQDGTVFNPETSDFVLKTFTADLTNQHSYNDVGPALLADPEYLGVNHNLCYYANPYLTDPGGDNICSGRPTLYVQFEDQISQATRDQTDLAWWVTRGDDITDWTKPKQSGDMKWTPAVDPDKNKLAWTSHATYPDETPLSLFIDVSRITNIKGVNAISSIFSKLGDTLPRSGNIVKVATFYVVRKPVPKSNKVVITNSHTNITYTLEFTNRIDGTPYTGVDNNFTVLQEDRNGQRYAIKVNKVWDSLTELQVKCTRDAVGMSSDVSQRQPSCGHTGDHDSWWHDRRNGVSTWRQELQASHLYKGISTTPNLSIGHSTNWPIGDNSFFAQFTENFCNEDDSSTFDTIFYFEHDPSATNTGEVPRLVGIVPKATSVDEGANLEFDVLTENIPDGTQIAWSLTNAGDFTNSSGFCTITSDAGTVSVSPDADQTTEGTEKFKAEIFYNGRKLGSVDVDILDTSLNPPPPPPPAIYTITPRLTDYNEGQTMEFDITVQNINLPSIECVVVGLELADLEMPTTSLTQNVVLTSNAGVLAVATKADLTTEGPQVFHVEMKVGTVVVATSIDVTLHDTSTAPSPPPPPPPPPTPPAPPSGGSGNVGGGVGGDPRGSGIYQEWFYYTPQSTEPAPVWREITDTQCKTIDLSSRGAIAADNDAPIGQEPKDRPSDSFTDPDSYFLYARFMDKSKNISDLYNTSFKIDNFDPYTIERPPGNLLRINAGGHVKPAKILDDEVYVFQTVTDDHSGVVYYTHEVNAGNWTKEVLSTAYVSSKAAPDNEYMIDELITIGSTPGEYEVKVRPYDQAENFDENKFTVIRSSQSIIWHSLSGARSITSPFIVEGTMKVEITGSPELIAGFYCTTDLYFHPPDSYFNTSHATHRIYDIPFSMMVPDMGAERAIMHIFTDGSPHRSYSQKDFTWSNSGNPTSGGGGNGNISSVDPPTIEIKEATQRLYTNSLTNNWGIFGDSGAIHVNGGKDRITGYIVNESSASPGAPPIYNTATQKFEDAASIGWNVYDTGAETFTEVENYTFTNTSYGSKTIYLHVATHAYNGTVNISGSPQTQTFSDSYTIEYIDDRIGPWVTVLNTTEDDTSITAAASKMNSYADSLYNPIEVFKRIEVLSTDNISMSGTLTDNESRIKRYTIGTYGSPPPYTELNPGQWTVLSTPASTTNFTFSSTLTPPNSIKTFYIWAVDIVGNISKTLVQFELYNPNYIVPTIGAAGQGTPYKFEGKPDEHPNRESIASMFGDGTFHTGMISNQTPKVKANRVHKLSEYRGLRVANTANNDSYEYLPHAADPANPQAPGGEPIKFSDFFNKKPRIDDMAVVPTVIPHNVHHPSEPLYVGDTRNISLTMDIDTGNDPTPWKLANDNVVDDDATWTAVFIAPNAPSQVSIPLPAPVNGVIQNYTFANEGTYIFTGLSSFGDTAGKVFIIIPPGTPVPPTQGPPINVVVPITTDPAGKTPVTIDYFIDQVGIGLDAAIAIDRSGSYVSNDPSYDDFAGALLDSLTTNQKVRVLLIENAVTPNPDYPKNPGDRWAVIAIFENIAGGSEKTSLIEAFPNMKYFLDYPSATSVPGQGGLNMSVNGGTVGDLAHLLTLPGSASLLQTGTGDYSELAQSIREGYDVTEPNAHGWQNISGKNNRYWYTKAHHAEKTMLKALDEFSRSSKTNAADTRWRVSWYPLASSIGVDHVQGWSNVESKVFDAINIYKDSMGHSDEPKIQAVAELAKGMGLSASELPAWRKTAAKLILLFSDEQDGPGQNSTGSPAHYKNPSHPEYYIKHLTVPGEEIGFIVMDGDRDTSFKDPSELAYNAGNAVYKKDNLQDAVALTSKYGGYLGKLRITSTGSDISDEVENAFDNYKAGVRFNLLSSIQNPQILTSNLSANTDPGNHASGTMVPIPYNDLIPYPNAATTWRRRAVFNAELDNAAVNSLGVSYIILYVSVLNSSDMEIMRREVRIRIT